MSSIKAKGHSISFNPDSLYREAEQYGASQSPKLNVSQVVCQFLKRGLIEVGWLRVDEPMQVSAEETALIVEARRYGIDVRKVVADAVEAKLATEAANAAA